MLAVGAPVTTTTLTAAPPITPFNNTSPFLQPLLPQSPHLEGGGSYSLDVPQGDQPPVPPIREGRPYRPDHWEWSTNRTFYFKNRFGKYLEMWPNGSTQGISDNTSFCVFVLLSHLVKVVMRGYVSDRYLCMNPRTYQLYSRTDVHEDCYIREAIRNGSGHNVYNFENCRTPQNKKCYLGMFRNGTMRLGTEARQSQSTAQWLPVPVTSQARKNAEDEKQMIRKVNMWTPPARPVVTTPKPVSRREQRRKRVRRWCRNLDVIVKNTVKFRKRCEHDCDILEKMIKYPERYMRRCLASHVRRRLRKKAQLSDPQGKQKIDSKKVRARVQILWPKRKEIFQRLRQLRRCSLNVRRKTNGKRRSCSKRELERQLKQRAKERSHSKASLAASATSQTKSRSRPKLNSRSDRHRIRHQKKKTGRKRHHGRSSDHSPTERRSKRSVLWSALTSR